MRRIKIKQIDAFTDRPFGGNPAGVVTSAEDLSDKEMQLISQEMNLSETAFVLPSKKADFRIRWFTPKREVLFCGHATVATLHALAEEGKFGMDCDGKFSFKIEALVGTLNVDAEKYGSKIKIFLESPKIDLVQERTDLNQLTKALRIKKSEINERFPVMRDKTVDYLYIPIKHLSALEKIDYDYSLLESLGNKKKVKGFVLFTRETFEKNSDVHSRFFTPFYGVREDPTTGSSHGPLGVYLVINKMVELTNNQVFIKAEQGDIMSRPGRLTVQIIKNGNNYKAKLISSAVTILEGELILP